MIRHVERRICGRCRDCAMHEESISSRLEDEANYDGRETSIIRGARKVDRDLHRN
jgi:hypothetical protein